MLHSGVTGAVDYSEPVDDHGTRRPHSGRCNHRRIPKPGQHISDILNSSDSNCGTVNIPGVLNNRKNNDSARYNNTACRQLEVSLM